MRIFTAVKTYQILFGGICSFGAFYLIGTIFNEVLPRLQPLLTVLGH